MDWLCPNDAWRYQPRQHYDYRAVRWEDQQGSFDPTVRYQVLSPVPERRTAIFDNSRKRLCFCQCSRSWIKPPTTVNKLAVQDNSNLQPLLIGLLNYDLPIPHLDNGAYGLQISSGPTFRIGGANNVSSFGYFGGLSVHLWKRMFLTPGVHVGEFADFPLGFSAGSTIPSGFGTLTPVRRWTARFAFAITYRTTSISTLGQKNSSPVPSPAQNQKTASQSPPPAQAAAGQPSPPSAGTPGSGGTNSPSK